MCKRAQEDSGASMRHDEVAVVEQQRVRYISLDNDMGGKWAKVLRLYAGTTRNNYIQRKLSKPRYCNFNYSTGFIYDCSKGQMRGPLIRKASNTLR